MTASWVLAGMGALLLVLGPRLRGVTWLESSPRLGIAMWQALCASAVAVPVLIGLAVLMPATAWVGGLAAVMHACVSSLQQAYGFHGDALEPTLGLLLAAAVAVWVTGWAGCDLLRAQRDRTRLRQSLAKVCFTDPGLGVQVLDSPAAAAFCIPGRSSQVVVTAGALAALTTEEVAGVLAHERAHLRARHHVAVTGIRALSRAFPKIALFAVAAQQTTRLVELAADDCAAKEVDRVTVASAIVRLAAMRAPQSTLAMADCTTPGVTATRVGRLLVPGRPMPRRRVGGTVVALIGVLCAPLAVALAPAVGTAITHLCTGIS